MPHLHSVVTQAVESDQEVSQNVKVRKNIHADCDSWIKYYYQGGGDCNEGALYLVNQFEEKNM